jgi:hypothetical protein
LFFGKIDHLYKGGVLALRLTVYAAILTSGAPPEGRSMPIQSENAAD